MVRKKKIFIIADVLDQQYAGVYVYLRGLLNALHASPKHDYILLRSKKTDEYPKFKTITLPYTTKIPGWMSLRLFFITPLIARTQRVDAVLEPTHFGHFFLPKKIKKITVIHDLTPILFPQLHTFQGRFFQKHFLPSLLKKSDVILSNSQSTSQDLLGYMPKQHHHKIKTILLGLNTFYEPVTTKSAQKKFNLSNNYILMAGTIEPRKNHLTVLQAFADWKQTTNTDTQLVIAGKRGWNCEEIYQCLEGHPFGMDIIVTGYVSNEELRELYSHAKFSIYASLYEGFGFPILESFACQTPCLAANNSSLPEVGADLCTYFETTNAHDCAGKMEKLAKTQPSEEEKEKLRIHAHTFSWSDHAGRFEEIIGDLDTPNHRKKS